MRQEYCIELLEEHENVNFYSIRLAGERNVGSIRETAGGHKPFYLVKNQRWHDGACR